MVKSIAITDGKIKIVAETWTGIRKKPVLSVHIGNCATKYASFNNEEAAEKFMNILCGLIGIERRATDEIQKKARCDRSVSAWY